MKKIALIFLLSFVFTISKAQLTHNWANKIGSTTADNAKAIATDSNGNIYVGGAFRGTVDFDPGPGTFNLTSAGGDDAYVVKYDANGNFLAVYTFTGNLYAEVISLCIDANNNLICTGGYMGSLDCDPSGGSFPISAGASGTDIFVLKINANGTFAWGYGIGGAAVDDYGIAVTSDINNNVLLTGYFQGSNVDLAPGGATSTHSAGSGKQIFVLKLDALGNYVWVFTLGSSSFSDVAYTITTDATGNIYIGGYFGAGADFDPSVSTFTLPNPIGSSNSDAFVSKYTAGGTFIWAKAFAGNSLENVLSLKLDASGNIYSTGNFRSTVDFDPSASNFPLVSSGSSDDVFISKLDNTGNFIWAKSIGSSGTDFGTGISVSNSNLHLTGYFENTVDFNPATPTVNLTSNGLADIFIGTYDVNGNYINSINIGGVGNDSGLGIVTSSSNITICGTFSLTCDFDIGAGLNTLVSSGNDDGFVVRYTNSTTQVTKKNSNTKSIQIYPNPTPSYGNFIIKTDYDGKYKIVNSIGKIIKEGNILVGENSIQLENISVGVYYLLFNNQNVKLIVY